MGIRYCKKIDAYLEQHNQRARERYQEALAQEEEEIAAGTRDPKRRQAGKTIDQRELRRSEDDPKKLESSKPQTQEWKPAERIGKFLQDNMQWGLLDAYQQETSTTGATQKHLKTTEDALKNPYLDNELMVVISRDPQKIGEMSSGQQWHSCMADDGVNFHYVQDDIKHGTLVAYLVSKDDPYARYPLMRQLIKPFHDDQGNTLMVPAKPYYSSKLPNANDLATHMKDTLTDFLREENQNAKGVFKMHPSLYTDGQATTLTVGKEWSVNALVTALQDFRKGALQEYQTEMTQLHEDTTLEPHKRSKMIAGFEHKIAQLCDSESLPRSYYRALQKSELGTMPEPALLMEATKNPQVQKTTDALAWLQQEKLPLPFAPDFFKHTAKWVQHPTIADALLEMDDNPKKILEHANHFADQPWAEAFIQTAAGKEPEKALEYAYHFADQPWAEKIIQKAAEQRPWSALAYANHFVDQPWAEKILEDARAALEKPATAVSEAAIDSPIQEKDRSVLRS